MSATRSARDPTSRNCSSVFSSCVPKTPLRFSFIQGSVAESTVTFRARTGSVEALTQACERLTSGARSFHDSAHLAKQRRAVVRDAVLDGPFNTTGPHRPSVTDRHGAGRIEHLQVLERIPIHHDQVREMPGTHSADPVVHAEDARVVLRHVLNDLDRAEPGLLMQLQFADQSKAVQLIDVPGVLSHPDDAATTSKVPECSHPDPVIFLPVGLVR